MPEAAKGISTVIVQDDEQATSAMWQAIPDAGKLVLGAIQAIESAFDVGGEVAVLLTCDAHMRVLNAGFRDQDKSTNVLSFPDGDPGRLGDIALALETLQREALADGKSFQAHLSHLVIHGVLHLMGFDHIEPGDAEEMEATEVDLLASIGYPDPYEHDEAA